jgi:hypothetical protein
MTDNKNLLIAGLAVGALVLFTGAASGRRSGDMPDGPGTSYGGYGGDAIGTTGAYGGYNSYGAGGSTGTYNGSPASCIQPWAARANGRW